MAETSRFASFRLSIYSRLCRDSKKQTARTQPVNTQSGWDSSGIRLDIIGIGHGLSDVEMM